MRKLCTVFQVRQMQLRYSRKGALHKARQVPFDADDQVRPVRVPHTVQMELGPPPEEPHGRRHVPVLVM